MDIAKKRKTIIVAEDDREMADAYADILGEYYTVRTCKDGGTLLDCIDSNVDLVILDLVMPGMNGIDALKKLRKFSQVPVIVISGITSPDAEKVASELGACKYICKPFEPRKVINAVKELIG